METIETSFATWSQSRESLTTEAPNASGLSTILRRPIAISIALMLVLSGQLISFYKDLESADVAGFAAAALVATFAADARDLYLLTILAIGLLPFGSSADSLAHLLLNAGLIILICVLAVRCVRTRSTSSASFENIESSEDQRIRMIRRVTGSITHDAMQPLAAAVTFARSGRNWIQLEGSDAPETTKCLEGILSALEQLEAVLERSRDSFLGRPAELRNAEIPELIASTLLLVECETEPRRVRVHTQLTPNMPTIIVDRPSIIKVLTNLIVNAAQAFDGHDQLNPQIRIAGWLEAGHVRIDVSDNGPGISIRNPDDIFEPFLTTKEKGLGLGLSMSRSIIEAHGGRISATSVPNEGTTIGFNLPLRRA